MVKKIVIPPLLINSELISGFKMKANHFNSFFAFHCTPLNNNSKVPGSQTYITNSKLCSLQCEDKVIIKIIRSLNITKAHGHDDISITMLKICNLAIIKPKIFRNFINNSTFSDLWKKSNICIIHKKVTNQFLYCQFVEKYLKDWFLILCLIILKNIYF